MRVLGRSRSFSELWLVVAIIVFMPATVIGLARTFDTMSTVLLAYRTGTWTVVEAQEELHTTRLAAAEFKLNPSQAALDALKLRFEVFWSRIPIILESSESAGVREMPDIKQGTEQISAMLPRMEEKLALAKVGDAESVQPFIEIFRTAEDPLEKMVQRLLVQDQERYRSGDIRQGMSLTFGALAVALLAGMALIAGNIMKTKRMSQLYERNRATEQERATQLAAIESSGEGIAIFDQRGRLRYSNEAFHSLIEDDYGRDLTLIDWRKLLSRRSALEIARQFSGSGHAWRGEVTGRTLAGQARAWEVHIMTRDEGGYVALLRDLTQRNQADQQRQQMLETLHRADKMSAIGRVAGGVAHDFNNILAAISGFTTLLEISLQEKPRQLHMLQQINAAANRGKELVKSIMTFSRAEQVERRHIDIGDICREAATMVGVSISGPTVFEVDIADGPLPALGNITQIDSAVVNLCMNALDALIDGRGKIRLEVRKVEIDGGRAVGMRGTAGMSAVEAPLLVEQIGPQHTRVLIGALDNAPGEHLRIRVEDTGTGMTEDVMRHMFEPFFTTKQFGDGTGLGLSSVLGIVTAHHGVMAVDSIVGKGTTFDIILPLLAAGATVQAQARPTPLLLPTTGLHILLVDDDPQAREALSLSLEALGCETAVCDSGDEALALLQDEPHLFDLVITDYLMPQMNGLELVAQLRARGFDRPVILTSGRLQDVSAAERARVRIDGVLAKPFVLREVGELVARVAAEARLSQVSPSQMRVTPMTAVAVHEHGQRRGG